MSSAKESLRSTVERLSDDDARQVLEFIHRLQNEDGRSSLTMGRLASDPTFKLPLEGVGPFRSVNPIEGKGIAASRLLMDDRR